MLKTLFLASAFALTLAGRASAAPSFFGPSGLLVIPTADTQAQYSWNVHGHGRDNLFTFGANFGLAKGLELGVSGAHFKHGDTKAVINGKYAFLQESGTTPGLAIGVVDAADQLNGKVGPYIVASKSLSSFLGSQMAKYNLRGHLGYGANSIFDDKVFAGVDLQVTQNIQAMVEWISGDVNFGARLGLGKGVRVDLASYDGNFGGGVSYAAGLR